MTLYIPTGPPGCGKSFLAEQMVEAGLLPAEGIVSSDAYRLILSGSESAQTDNGKVFSIFNRIIETRMKNNLDTFADATHLKKDDLLQTSAFAELTDREIVIIRSNASNELCLERNARRERFVPEEAMRKMFARRDTLYKELDQLAKQVGAKIVSMDQQMELCHDIIFNKVFPLSNVLPGLKDDDPVTEALLPTGL